MTTPAPRPGFELEFELDLARAPGDVFVLLIDPGHFRVLDPALIDHGPPGPLAAGGEGWFKHRRGGMTARTTYRVTAFDDPSRLEVAISGMGYAMTEAAELEAIPSGTRARFVDRVADDAARTAARRPVGRDHAARPAGSSDEAEGPSRGLTVRA